MKLIIGLGNKGEDYKETRHNVGFMTVEKVFEKLGKTKKFSLDKKFESEVVKIGDLMLVKPQKFMNNSGRAVRKIMDYYKMELGDIVVIHDDLDIKMGEYKIQRGVGPKIHNGLNSVEQTLGEKDFLRVRIGVDNRQQGTFYGAGADYVLAKLSSGEKKLLDEVIDRICEELAVTFGLKIK